MEAYYDRRAPEYDQWYEGTGRFALRERPAWRELLHALADALRALPPARALDDGCGTAHAMRRLPGESTGLDQSPQMLEIAARRLPDARFVQRDALQLPFPDDSLERIATTSFYGHLEAGDRERFLAEARLVAPEPIVVDAAMRDDVEPEEWQERILADGSRWAVFKRCFTPKGILHALGGGEIVHAGRWFVAVHSPRA